MQSVIAAPENESRLVQAAQADIAAFTPIYEFYFPRVYNYVRYRIHDPEITDDLTAQIFEQVMVNMGRYRIDQAPFGAWLFGIVRNRVTDYYRVQKRRAWLSLDSLFDHAAPDPPPETHVESQDQARHLLAAVTTLPEREQDVIGLKFAAHMTNRQIAALTGLSEQHVAVLLYRAIRQLRQTLQENHHG